MKSNIYIHKTSTWVKKKKKKDQQNVFHMSESQYKPYAFMAHYLSATAAINVTQRPEICCIFLFHAWMCIRDHHGNNQSSLGKFRAANYPTVKHTVFDCICIFHELNCQCIWDSWPHQLILLLLLSVLNQVFTKSKTIQEMLMDDSASYSCKAGSFYFLSIFALGYSQLVKIHKPQTVIH